MERAKSHKVLKGIGIFLLIAVIAVAITGFLLYQSAQRALAEANTVQDEVMALQESLTSNDAEQIRKAVNDLDNSIHLIHLETSNPLWGIAEGLPFIGSDVHAVRTLSDVFLDLDENVLVPFGKNANYLTIDGYITSEGISLDGITELTNLAKEAQPIVARSYATIDALPPTQLARVQEFINTTRDALDTTNQVLIIANDIIDGATSFFGLSAAA